MKSSFVSTYSINFAVRDATARLQARLPDLQTEMTTGRHADSGLALGSQTGKLATLRGDVSNLESIIGTNNRTETRLSMTQAGLTQLNGLASSMTNAVGVVLGDVSQREPVTTTAKNMVAEMTSILNTQVDGVYLFAGENADIRPLTEFEGSAVQTQFRNDFNTFFGFAINDPLTATITEAQLDTFITTVAEPLFLGAGWTANLSAASDNATLARVEDGITAQAGVTANAEPFQKMAIGAIMAAELYSSDITGKALFALGEYTISQVSSAEAEITKIQGQLGISQERIKRANENMETQIDLLEQFEIDLDGVDSYETAVTINTMLTQLETSYSVTARLQQLSIINFLR